MQKTLSRESESIGTGNRFSGAQVQDDPFNAKLCQPKKKKQKDTGPKPKKAFQSTEQLHLNAWTITDEIKKASYWKELREERKDSKQDTKAKGFFPLSKEFFPKDKMDGPYQKKTKDGPYKKETCWEKESNDSNQDTKKTKDGPYWFLNAEKAWDMFKDGRWKAYPGAVLIQYDIRSFSNVQMETGTFMFSAHVRLLFFDPVATANATHGEKHEEKDLPTSDATHAEKHEGKALPKSDAHDEKHEGKDFLKSDATHDETHEGKDLPNSSTYYGKYSRFYKKEHRGKSTKVCIPPFIKTRNATGEEGDDAFHSAWGEFPRFFDEENKIWKMEILLKNVKCCENFEPDDFPYDAQACSIITALIHSDRNVSYIARENSVRSDEEKIQHFLLPLPGQTRLSSRMPEYYLLPTMIAAYNLRRVKQGKNGLHNSRPLSVVRLRVLRKHGWYTINYMLILFLLSSLSFMVFRIEELADRLTFNSTILLTITAYKYNATSILPRFSNLTNLDRYIFASFVIVLVIMLFNFIASFFEDFEQSSIECYIYLALFPLWVGANLYWFGRKIYAVDKLKQKEECKQLSLSIPEEVITDSRISPHKSNYEGRQASYWC